MSYINLLRGATFLKTHYLGIDVSFETIQNPLVHMISKVPLTAEKRKREKILNCFRVRNMFIQNWDNGFLLVLT